MKDNWKKVWKKLGKLLGVLLSLGMLTGLYFTLIIGQPQKEEGKEETVSQPLLSASPAISIDSEGELQKIIAAFPAPVMCFMSGSGMIFVSGNSTDAAWQGQFGRVLTLYWQTPEGKPMILQSIYPAEAIELMGKQDYIFSSMAGPVLAGRTSVRMENAENIRLHMQMEDEGLYILIVPKSLDEDLPDISRSIQLFVVDKEKEDDA